jgi:hypothetical protein
MTPQLVEKTHVRPAFAAAGEGLPATRPKPWAGRRTDKWPVPEPTAAGPVPFLAGNSRDKWPLTGSGVDGDKWPITKSDLRHEKSSARPAGSLFTASLRADKWPLESDKWPLGADKWPLN